jgi:hypothetical protein
MANEKHLLLTIGGSYTLSNLQVEQWQTTLRLALFAGPSGGSAPDVGTLPNNWEPAASNVSRTETNWTITSNWKIDLGAGAWFNPDDYLNDQVAPAVTTWSNKAYFSSAMRVESLRLYPIGPNGKVIPAPPYSSGTPCALDWTSNLPDGTGTGGLMPLQIAAVASHRTPQTGRRGRGRMFLPGLNKTAVGQGGQISNSDCQSIRDGQIALLEDVSYSDTLTEWYLFPIVTGSPWTQYARINSVQVGDFVDTQRRRRRQLPETYVSGTVARPS